MKIIEALKQVKDLERKADDLVSKIKNHSALSNFQTPEYPDQKKQVSEWVQAHCDVLKEIERLRLAIQRTNLGTEVSIELGGKTITKQIAAWIHRRRDLAGKQMQAWNALTDRNIQEGHSKTPSGDVVEIKIQRFYNPEERDKMMNILSGEASAIDSKLEIVNAVTDIIE